MTCHWFPHHAGVNCIPVLTCQLHRGLIALGEHLGLKLDFAKTVRTVKAIGPERT